MKWLIKHNAITAINIALFVIFGLSITRTCVCYSNICNDSNSTTLTNSADMNQLTFCNCQCQEATTCCDNEHVEKSSTCESNNQNDSHGSDCESNNSQASQTCSSNDDFNTNESKTPEKSNGCSENGEQCVCKRVVHKEPVVISQNRTFTSRILFNSIKISNPHNQELIDYSKKNLDYESPPYQALSHISSQVLLI